MRKNLLRQFWVLVCLLATFGVSFGQISIRPNPISNGTSKPVSKPKSLKKKPEIGQIVGGTKTSITSVPWQVSIQDTATGEHGCGGTIISNRWIYTAAHCLPGLTAGSIRIRAGFSNQSQDEATVGVLRGVKRIIIHPMYDLRISSDYDFALLELSDTLPLAANPNTMKAILPITKTDSVLGLDAPGILAKISGWGAVSFQGPAVDSLQYAQLPIVSIDSANAPERYDGRISQAMLPAGFLGVGGIDACQGDSGGPLAVPDGNGGFKLAGITSWGDGCAEPNKPGIWSRVSAATSFLEMAQNAPVNDECSGAITLVSDAGAQNFWNLGATNSNTNSPNCSGMADDDVWFRFTAIKSFQSISITSLNPFENQAFEAGDPAFEFYSVPSCEIEGSRFCGDFNTSNIEDFIVGGLTPGNTYLFRVYERADGPGGGAFKISVDTLKNFDLSFSDLSLSSNFNCQAYLSPTNEEPIGFKILNKGINSFDSVKYAIKVNGVEVFRQKIDTLLLSGREMIVNSPYTLNAFGKFNESFLVEIENLIADDNTANDSLFKVIREVSAAKLTIKSFDTTICYGGNSILTYELTPHNSNSVVLWQKEGGLFSIADSTTLTLPGTGKYTLFSYNPDSDCSSDEITITVFSNLETPVISQSGIIGQCGNEPITLEADSGYTKYLWNTGDTTRIITVTETGKYFFQATDSLGCLTPPSAEAAVYMVKLPTIEVSNNKACFGQYLETIIQPRINGTVFGSGTLRLYSKDTSTVPFQNISSRANPSTFYNFSLRKDTTFYAEFTARVKNYIGYKDVEDPNRANAVTDFGDRGLIINVAKQVLLDSVTVDVRSTLNRLTINFERLEPNGEYSPWSKRFTNDSLGVQRVPLFVTLDPGTYRVTATGTDGFMGIHTNAKFPYISPNNGFEIVGNNDPNFPDDYYFFYNFGVIEEGCNSQRSKVEIKMITPSNPEIEPEFTTCGSDSVWLKVQPPAGSVAVWNNQIIADSIFVSEGFYNVIYRTTGNVVCESGRTDLRVRRIDVPKAQLLGSNSVCKGDSTWVRVTNKPVGSTILWNDVFVGDSIAAKGGLVYAKIIDTTGCIGDTAGINIQVKTVVTPLVAFTKTAICSGDSSVLKVTNKPALATVIWSVNGSVGDSITVKNNTPITVRYALDGCTSNASEPASLVVNALPTKPVIIGPSSFCPLDSAVLRITNPVPGVIYSWSDGRLGDSIKVGATNTFKVVATNSANCISVSDTLRTLANSVIPAPIIDGDTSFCQGESGFIWVTNKPAGASVLWSNNEVGDTLQVNTPNSYTATFVGVSCVERVVNPWIISQVILPTPTFTTTINPTTGIPTLTATNTFGLPFAWLEITVDTSIVVSLDTNFIALPGIRTYVLVIVDTLTECGQSSLPTIINNLTPSVIASSIKLYPNPANNEVRLDFPEGIEINQVRIFSVTGQLLKQETGEQLLSADRKINLENLSAGYYRVAIYSNGIWVNQPLIIKR